MAKFIQFSIFNEKYCILLDKPHLDFGTYEIASSTQRFPSIESDQIDRSFIRWNFSVVG